MYGVSPTLVLTSRDVQSCPEGDVNSSDACQGRSEECFPLYDHSEKTALIVNGVSLRTINWQNFESCGGRAYK